MDDTLKLSDYSLTEAQALAALYNASKPLGKGMLHFNPKPMTETEAEAMLLDRPGRKYFDYLHGRVMKVEIGPEIEPWLYDRDNGAGAAERALQAAQKALRR